MENKTPNSYKSNNKPTWCPGCGDFAVLSSLMGAMAELNYEPDETAIISGIGCSSRLPFFTSTYGFHTIHGRALPIATGLKAANPKTNVITVGGDGDGFSIGGNHFVHTARKNPDITYIVMDNEIYALTKGQNSPTSHEDVISKINPYDSIEHRINPVLMALSSGATYIARGHSSNPKELKELIKNGLEHKGFSFIHVLSPCVQYNDGFSFESVKERIIPISEDHDTSNVIAGMNLAYTPGCFYTGLFYKEEKPTFEEKLENVCKLSQASKKKAYQIEEIMNQFA